MSILYIPVGISGAGKSTFFSHLKNVSSVSPDDIRRRMGDVSDQSKGYVVFQRAYKWLEREIEKGNDVYFDATNLSLKAIKDVIKHVNDDVDIKIILFNDSENWEECQKRVKSDISNGVDRAKTHNVMVNGKPLQQIMSEDFVRLKNNPAFWEYCKSRGIEVKEI